MGVHFSLSEDEVQELYRLERDCERLEYLQEVIEPEYFNNHPERKVESDKAWDAIHRALTDGNLSAEGGEYPLSHVVLGGEQLYSDSDYILSLKTPEQVRDVGAALFTITATEFRMRYFAIPARSFGRAPDEKDFSYTWEWFNEVRDFWLRAAEEERYVLFTAEQ